MSQQEHVIFQLMTPLIFTICAGGFWAIWFNYRHMKAAGLWALAYSLGAVGFTANVMHDPLQAAFARMVPADVASPVVSCLVLAFFVSGLWLFVAGTAHRYRRPVPFRMMAVISGVVGGLVAWNFTVEPNLAIRALMASIGAAMILSLTLFMVPRDARPIDHAIFALTACAVALFAALPFTLPTLFQTPFSALLSVGSPVASVLQFTVSGSALTIGMVLFVAVGMDVILELQHRSDTDGLTGMRNRLAFEIAARRAIADAERRGNALSLVVADIDHFKSVNDTFGHSTGDVVIRLFAATMECSCRKADAVGRIGGEELCMLLPTADASIGRRVAEKARNIFAHAGLELMHGRRPLTASFGVAQWNAGESYEDLFARADAALYLAKNSGRNRVKASGDATGERRGQPKPPEPGLLAA